MHSHVEQCFWPLSLLALICAGLLLSSPYCLASETAAQANLGKNSKEKTVNRIQQTKVNREKLFGDAESTLEKTDPDFAAMRDRLIYGQIASHSTLNDKQRMLITLVSLTAGQNLGGFSKQVEAALSLGITPVEIKEALYHCAPYAGFPRAEAALCIANQVFQDKGVKLPLPSQSTVTEETRFKDGLEAQKAIFGPSIEEMHKKVLKGQEDIIIDYLSSYCFGDIYTRQSLDLKTRELLTFAIIATLGGCEPQLKAHIQGNANMGTSKQNLVDAIVCMMPYLGFPRTLNALSCVNAMLKD